MWRSPFKRPQGRRQKGFSYIEMIVVCAVLGILATAVIPVVRWDDKRRREARLRVTLRTLRAALDQYFSIRDCMQSPVVCIGAGESIRRAAEILGEGQFHCLPVVEGDQRLVGIVTSTDLIRYLADQF